MKKNCINWRLLLLLFAIVVASVIITVKILLCNTSIVAVEKNKSVECYSPESRILENVYIVSNEEDIIKYISDGKQYEYKGKMAKQFKGFADIEFVKNKMVKIYIRDEAKNVDDALSDNLKSKKNQDVKINVLLKNNNIVYYSDFYIKGKKLTANNKIIDCKSGINVISLMNKTNKLTIKGEKIFVKKNKANQWKEYEGEFHILKSEKGIIVVNTIKIEKYVKYVLPSEMPVEFPIEALKAQAVCARTFAYSHLLDKTYSKYGADLDDTTAYQVYNASGRLDKTDKAVEETRDIVVSNDNKLAMCYYFSTSPGRTEDMEVWGSETPNYIIKKKSKDTLSPFYRWTANIKYNRFYDKQYGKLKSLIVKKISDSGYVLKLVAKFEKGKRIYNTENSIRIFLGKYMLQILLRDGTVRKDMKTIPSSAFIIRSSDGNGCKLEGGGFGHGIGLSQYGAAAMAEKSNNYKDIIKYYYKNIQVKKITKQLY